MMALSAATKLMAVCASCARPTGLQMLEPPASGLLVGVTATLTAALGVQPSDRSDSICLLHAESIAPNLPAVYETSLSTEDRRAAIIALSNSLDRVEEKVVGPLLTGSQPSPADALLFPSVVLLEQSLPIHFGWTPWTNEAIFWRRPRLHAWREMMDYETSAREAAESVAALLAEEDLDWSAVRVDVPTSKLRTFPRHAL